ncbi:BC1881 family protein [Paenibacillus tianmuensis]|uniref:BC1881 family protein n=1 Tax=Paenibacillus tianmuensis TaxID=624147 RepID=UPI00115F8854|nr:BC1881 family protein [Paenibacillus tianmuensis]
MLNTNAVSTSKLTDELLKRPGIRSVKVEPYEEIKIVTGHNELVVQGPAIVLVNQD